MLEEQEEEKVYEEKVEVKKKVRQYPQDCQSKFKHLNDKL